MNYGQGKAMNELRWIAITSITTLLFAQNTFAGLQRDYDAVEIKIGDLGSARITMTLPDSFGAYAEIYGCTNLLTRQWSILDGWIPNYGSTPLTWNDAARTNVHTFFYMIHDATLDADGDGYSNRRELYISQTDPESFNYADEEGDGMHDFWEIKLFGNIWTQDGYDDSDGDGLLNHQELIWSDANIIKMVSDPSLYDTDGEGLNDFTEIQKQTDPLSPDSDADGLNDAFEVLGSPPTDPNNPDILAPIVVLAGG